MELSKATVFPKGGVRRGWRAFCTSTEYMHDSRLLQNRSDEHGFCDVDICMMRQRRMGGGRGG